jgi:putative ABC transport system permease protein
MISLTIALRSVWKNRRRSLATLLSIAVGFTAINLFSGYIQDTYSGLRLTAIHYEGLGHVTLAKPGFFERGGVSPAKYMFSRDELQRLRRLVEEQPEVKLTTPSLGVSGLVSNGKISTIFIAEGEEPESAAQLRALPTMDRSWQQDSLDPRQPSGGLVSSGLAALLGVEAGGAATLLSTTLDGQTNALDLDVLGTWDTGTSATNDKLLRLPLEYVQRLLDTEGASRIIVLLRDDASADAFRSRLQPLLKEAGIEAEIRTWEELSVFYRQVKNLFDLIFLFLFSIVFIVVLMGIVNTLTMSVMERVREIGTLRAIGMRRSGVLRLFALEGGVLGLLGCLVGVALTLFIGAAINGSQLSYTPPSSSSPVPLAVMILPMQMLVLVGLLSLVSMLAACVPARRAAQLEVVDALGHV